MPDPVRLLATLSRAVEAHRSTPGRRGRLVDLEGSEVLIAGDLHGNLENFRRILQRAALDRFPNRHLILQELIHGPFEYATGGDRSHQLFDLAAALKLQYPARFHFLAGNHEMAQFTGRHVMKNDRDLNALFLDGLATAYGERADEVHAAYRDVFLALPMALRTANRVWISHSLPAANRLEAFAVSMLEREDVPESEWHPGGSLYSLAWGRDVSAANARAFLEKVDADLLITGHVPCEEGFQVPNDRQLILDSLGVPAATCLFPIDRPLSHAELIAGVELL